MVGLDGGGGGEGWICIILLPQLDMPVVAHGRDYILAHAAACQDLVLFFFSPPLFFSSPFPSSQKRPKK